MAGQFEGTGKETTTMNSPTLDRGPVPTNGLQKEKGKASEASAAIGAAGSSMSGEQVEHMMARLRLTAVESEAVVIDDTEDLNLIDPDRAFVGKVLAPNKLHIQTISAAMRPAWGNPRGLVFNPAGNNLFIAEFGSKADRDRVMEGSPWTVGRHAVLMKKYDVEVQPHMVVFDRLAIWARILALPNRLMYSTRGMEIAKPIGLVKKIEADALGRCWGVFMRVRVEVKVHEPLLRCVTVFSSKLQTTETYAVQYEQLPYFCFSCGLLGHSTLACATPADRDENGDLPYTAKKLSAPEDSKKNGGSKSGTSSASLGGDQPASGSRGSTPGPGRGRGKGANFAANRFDDSERSSPLMEGRGAGRGRGRSAARGRGRVNAAAPGRDIVPSTTGQKRKAQKSQKSQVLSFEQPENANSLALVMVEKNSELPFADEDAQSEDSAPWYATFVYGEPRRELRHIFWDLLRRLNHGRNGPWICCGDFNEVLCHDEHYGVRDRSDAQIELFRSCMEDCSLTDMGFSGPKFTWCNRRDAQSNVRVCLDRAVCNNDFLARFDACHVENVITTSSDHYAIVVDFDAAKDSQPRQPVQHSFRYEAMWCRADDYKATVEQAWNSGPSGPNPLYSAWSSLIQTASSLQKWSRESFGAVRRNIQRLERKLRMLRDTPICPDMLKKERDCEKQLCELFEREEIMARQRSRVDWLREGDRNTAFFHARASARKKNNRINVLVRDDGSKCDDQEGIKAIPKQLLYTQSSPSFTSVLVSSIRNPRLFTPTTVRPLVIVTPTNASHVQAAVVCGRQNDVRIRVRSGGHDYEGLSYRSVRPEVFAVVDLANLRSMRVDQKTATAWVDSGATLGELYYAISKASKQLAFPAGLCPTVGVGGHFSGGGFGMLLRKYGVAIDNVLDATLVDAKGRLLDKPAMGTDVFWAIRGGGGESFGIVLSWKVKLVAVPPTVTMFSVPKSVNEGAVDILTKWQEVAPALPDDLFIRVVVQKQVADFQSMYLGTCDTLLPLMSSRFPELGINRSHCKEMSWIQSVPYIYLGSTATVEDILNRTTSLDTFNKATSDYVRQAIPKDVWVQIFAWLAKPDAGLMITDPYGGKITLVEKEASIPPL
ncbi:hypothetical protein ACQ4PT_056296 [Festuca glaucescens]